MKKEKEDKQILYIAHCIRCPFIEREKKDNLSDDEHRVAINGCVIDH